MTTVTYSLFVIGLTKKLLLVIESLLSYTVQACLGNISKTTFKLIEVGSPGIQGVTSESLQSGFPQQTHFL